MPPSPGGILNPVLGSRLAKGPLNPPGLVQVSNSDESEIPRPNGDIIPILPNSHEAVLESLGSMSPAELVGVCNEVIVPKEMDEVKTFSAPICIVFSYTQLWRLGGSSHGLLMPHGLAMSKYHGWSLRVTCGSCGIREFATLVAWRLLDCRIGLIVVLAPHILCGFWDPLEAKTAGCGPLFIAGIERSRSSISYVTGWPSRGRAAWVVLPQNGS
ncbi:hypothetical protein Nepgr_008041 [Nepenthes gracilis]|uniref:Uncharacterized protein n=1 Tax=Nepenthes gracilis TaxID=150966 RepID=A0AAD3S8V4_NEPGR|nr:hypothetical protein Nepgr_008041 [Nepenthes gracilis]